MRIESSRAHDWIFSLGLRKAIEISDSKIRVCHGNTSREIPFEDVLDLPKVEESLLWKRVVIPCNPAPVVFQGVPRAQSLSAFSSALKQVLLDNCKRQEPRANRIKNAVDELQDDSKWGYLKASTLQRWLLRFDLTAREKDSFSRLFLRLASEEQIHAIESFRQIVEDYDFFRQNHNKKFILRALTSHGDFFDQIEKNPLTERQRLACVTDEDNNIVLAGAGSGKTSVIVGKAGFIQRMGWAKPEEILILAFGRKASRETQERIYERLGEESQIRTSTFHSLGLQIIGEATQSKPRLHDTAEHETHFLEYVDSLISQFTTSKEGYAKDLIDYFSLYLHPLKSPEDFESKGEYFEHVNQVRPTTLRGETVKSRQEVQLANFFLRYGIEYQYEKDYEVPTSTAEFSQYRPDFFLPDYGIYLEHFGINKDGNPPEYFDQDEVEAYRQGIVWKREIHERYKTTLLETFSYQFDDGTIWRHLKRSLRELEVSLVPVPIENLLKPEQSKENARKLALLFVNFINLQKNKNATIDELEALAKANPGEHPLLKLLGFKGYDSKRLAAFLRIYRPVYKAFQSELRASNTVDFNDMINEAVRHVSAGRFQPPWKYILVDEFQDISTSRAHLIQALAQSRDDAVIFCVGDDWQSIYRFAGSDLRFLNRFSAEFGPTARTDLDLTFRFNDRISKLATTFITKNPDQLKKEITAVRKADRPTVTVILHTGNHQQALVQVLTRIAERFPRQRQGASLYMIGRYQHTRPDCFNALKQRFPSIDVSFDTIHASKGKEADFVVLLGLEQGKYGFPSEIQNDRLLDLLLPTLETYKDAEERRLFYVGLTRARFSSFVLADRAKPSRFVQELASGRTDYDCELIDVQGNPLGDAPIVQCDDCKTGTMTLRVNPANDSSFYGCSNFPLCGNKLLVCPECSKGPLEKYATLYRCGSCGYEVEACPRCRRGILKRREGQYGPFFGCSYFRGEMEFSCRYTRDIVATE